VADEPVPADDGERGSAVVDFVMVSVLIVTLLLAVLQVAVYVHVRNVVTASAQAGARYAANADVDSAAGAGRTVEVVARATSMRTAQGLTCTSAEEVDASGLTLVVVRCTGAVPSLLAVLGDLLPLEVTGRAVKEAA
jgi:Flp pilus assembly protein TadG